MLIISVYHAYFMLLFASTLSIISLSIWLLFTSKNKLDAPKLIFAFILIIILGLNAYAIWGTGVNLLFIPQIKKLQLNNYNLHNKHSAITT